MKVLCLSKGCFFFYMQTLETRMLNYTAFTIYVKLYAWLQNDIWETWLFGSEGMYCNQKLEKNLMVLNQNRCPLSFVLSEGYYAKCFLIESLWGLRTSDLVFLSAPLFTTALALWLFFITVAGGAASKRRKGLFRFLGRSRALLPWSCSAQCLIRMKTWWWGHQLCFQLVKSQTPADWGWN